MVCFPLCGYQRLWWLPCLLNFHAGSWQVLLTHIALGVYQLLKYSFFPLLEWVRCLSVCFYSFPRIKNAHWWYDIIWRRKMWSNVLLKVCNKWLCYLFLKVMMSARLTVIPVASSSCLMSSGRTFRELWALHIHDWFNSIGGFSSLTTC